MDIERPPQLHALGAIIERPPQLHALGAIIERPPQLHALGAIIERPPQLHAHRDERRGLARWPGERTAGVCQRRR